VNIRVPKSLINDASSLRVYVDGAPLTYTATSQSDAWIISFNYHQSSHTVTINLGSTVENENQLGQWGIIGVISIIIVISVVFVLFGKEIIELHHRLIQSIMFALNPK